MLYCSMISILSEIPRESIVLPYFPQIVVLLSPPSILEIIFRNNEHIMIQQYNTGISNRKTKKKIRIFDLKLWWRSNLCLGYNGIFRSRLFFFSKIHTLDKHILFIYYTCKLFYIRILSLKNIITPGKIFSKKRGRMIDLSWFTERATLLLSYSSIVGWNIGKKKKRKKNTRGNDCQENGLIACQPVLYCSLLEKVEWFVARGGRGGGLFLAVYQARDKGSPLIAEKYMATY